MLFTALPLSSFNPCLCCIFLFPITTSIHRLYCCEVDARAYFPRVKNLSLWTHFSALSKCEALTSNIVIGGACWASWRLLRTDLKAGIVAYILGLILSLWLPAKVDWYALTFVFVDAHSGDAHQLGTLAFACLLVHSEE